MDDKKRARLRLVAVAVMFAALLFGAKATGLADAFDAQGVREQIQAAGVWGVALYLVIFAAGELLHVPGMVFVAAGILAYGRVWGFGVAYLGSLVSVSASFLLVRLVGGRALRAIDKPFIKRMLDRLQERPVRTVIVLRLILWLAPPLNYALALTELRFRDHLLGSALGLLPVLLAATFFFDWMFTHLL